MPDEPTLVQAIQTFHDAAHDLARQMDVVADAARAALAAAEKDDTISETFVGPVTVDLAGYDDMHLGVGGSCWTNITYWINEVDDLYALVQLGESRRAEAVV